MTSTFRCAVAFSRDILLQKRTNSSRVGGGRGVEDSIGYGDYYGDGSTGAVIVKHFVSC